MYHFHRHNKYIGQLLMDTSAVTAMKPMAFWLYVSYITVNARPQCAKTVKKMSTEVGGSVKGQGEVE